MALGNGVAEGYAYNARLQPASITAVKNSTKLLSLTNDYGWASNNGNVLSQAISWASGSVTQTFAYDGVNRLGSASQSSGAWVQSTRFTARVISFMTIENFDGMSRRSPPFVKNSGAVVPASS